MGSDWGDFWRRILRLSWFGHQSLFDLIPTFVVPCTTGHLPAFSSVFASMFPSDRVPGFFERLLEAPGMRLPSLGERLEPVGDLVEAFLAGHARHARIHVGVFVGLARDRGLEVVAGRTDLLAGRGVAHFLEIFEIAVRVPGLALGSRAEHGGDIVEALDVGLLGEIEIVAARLALAGGRFLQILLGLGSLERRHVPFPAWSEKPMTRGCARRTRESMKFRRFLVCGWRRVPVDADDHVDAADGAAGGRLRQAGDGDMLARNVEQPAGILEKEVMMVTGKADTAGLNERRVGPAATPGYWRQHVPQGKRTQHGKPQ